MKTNPEFDRFTGFMDKLARVPHSELKAELDKDRAAKDRAAEQQVVERRAGQALRDNPKLQVPY